MGRPSLSADRRVFISHAQADTSLARLLQQRLRAEGVPVWSADLIPAGERWGAAIQREIATADDVVVLLSKAAQASPSVSVEVGAAVASAESHEGRRVIPVAVDDLEPTGLLASYQWLKGAGKSPAQLADEIVAALQAPGRTVSKEAARAEELRDLRVLESALAAMREHETLAEARRTRLISLSLIVVLSLTTTVTAIAVLSGVEISGAALAATLSAGVSVLAAVFGFLLGRSSRRAPNE